MTVEASDNRPPRPLLSIQALRAVAAAMVLLYHLATTSAYGWSGQDSAGDGLARLARAIGFAGVDLFFVISGVVMVYSSYDRLGDQREIIPFVKRRITRIYPLYWVCTAAVLGLAWLAPDLVTRDKFAWPDIVKSLLLWPQSEYPIVAVGWTLTFEMYFYLVFAAFFALPRRLLPTAIVLWGVATLVAFAALDQPDFRSTAEACLQLPLYASPLALEFIAGCFIGWRARRGTMPWGTTALIGGVFAMAGVGGYFGIHAPRTVQCGLERVVLFGGAATLIVYGCIALERQGRLTVPRLIKLCGDASYSLYLTHMYTLWGVAWLWPRSPEATAPAGREAMTLLALAACALVAAASYRLIERPLHRHFLRHLAVAKPHGPGRTVAE